MVTGVDAFDWLPWPKIFWARPERLSLEHRASVNIYSVPDEIESEIKKRVKMPKQTGPSYQQSISEILLTTGVKDRKGTSAQGKKYRGRLIS